MSSRQISESLLIELVKRQSITPNDAGCMKIIATFLEQLEFTCTTVQFEDVTNMLALYGDTSKPMLLWVGHTDVVPVGDSSLWSVPPFAAEIKDGTLYGRGASDMKAGIAAWCQAVHSFLNDAPNLNFCLGVLLTSDEEGEAQFGVRKMIPWLEERNIRPKWCLVGEPSAFKVSGDRVRVGRRGVMNCHVNATLAQGHVAWKSSDENAANLLVSVVDKIVNAPWPKENKMFPGTYVHTVHLSSGAGASNIVPATAQALINFRFPAPASCESMISLGNKTIGETKKGIEVVWDARAEPWYSEAGLLRKVVEQVIVKTQGTAPEFSTSGGTSDGRFFASASWGPEVLELGTPAGNIHGIDEYVELCEVSNLSVIYTNLLKLMNTQI